MGDGDAVPVADDVAHPEVGRVDLGAVVVEDGLDVAPRQADPALARVEGEAPAVVLVGRAEILRRVVQVDVLDGVDAGVGRERLSLDLGLLGRGQLTPGLVLVPVGDRRAQPGD